MSRSLVSAATTALLVAACSGPALESGNPSASAPVVAIVDEVIDGDTIRVRIGERYELVRLLGIDTPEKPGGPRPAECFGAEASDFARSILPVETPVVLSRDIDTRDQYGRLLAYVHRQHDQLFVNHALVEQGYATTLFFAPNTAAEPELSAAADRARRNWIGFWQACGGPDVVETPPD